MKTFAVFVTTLVLSACGEYAEISYSDLNAADADGAIERGWIPEWVPSTSVHLQEAHDLDTNQSALSLQFSEKEQWTVPPSCKPIARDEVPGPPFRPGRWPSDVPASSMATHRHVYFSCEESKAFMALSTTQGELFYWRPHGI
jgi:hypothetical protein